MLSHFHLYGELRFSGVIGLLGLREDDDESRMWMSYGSRWLRHGLNSNRA